jgi:predicted N-acyltransferase
MSFDIQIATSYSQVKAQDWDALVTDSPLLCHAFLSALEETKCVGEGTGWQPYPILVYELGKLVGAAPLYLKVHSYGEYVFDWSWAEAYERSGLNYYPKLLVAIPFTPITGARLISNKPDVQAMIIRTMELQMQQYDLSSAHVLFTDESSSEALKVSNWLRRDGVQFRWHNDHFSDFDDFLSHLSHDKRKKIKQERKKVTNAGVICKRIKGADIRPQDWDFFYECYTNTYLEHRSTPYLTRSFFDEIGTSMPKNILLIIAELDGRSIAASLNIYGQQSLYGRYWGALEYVPNLHFELCYYQAQEFCIAENIKYFEGGAQGEHKLARGFLPRPTFSYHKIANPDFDKAINEFAHREASGMVAYYNELEERAPFKIN